MLGDTGVNGNPFSQPVVGVEACDLVGVHLSDVTLMEVDMKIESVLSMDATSMLEAFKNKDLSPEQAVDIYIAQQEKLNPVLNLIVEDRYDEARQEAKEFTRKYSEGNAAGNLAGIPMSMKESFDVKGMHTTGGMVSHRDNIALADAEAVSRLKTEGAVFLCKTNTPTLCFCQETDNNLFGRSNNPWNLDYTTGGSSGGEAALISVGGAAAGFGSDIGGSIRIPSHFNGVIGFKAGAFKFPDRGHFPSVEIESQKRLLGFGPIVKSVRDAVLIYSVIFPEFKHPESWELPDNLIAVTFDSFHKTQCTPETEEVLKRAQNALSANGVKIKLEVPALMNDVSEIWQLIMSEDKGKELVEIAYPGQPRGFLIDWLKAKLGLKAKHHPFLSWAMIGTNLFPPDTKQLEWINHSLTEGRLEMESLLGHNGVFVTPVYPSPAKKHGMIYAEIFSIMKTFRWVMPFTALGNAYGLPSIVVPCGWSNNGLPICLQVACLPGNEHTLFKVAHFLEKTFGGYTRNTVYG